MKSKKSKYSRTVREKVGAGSSIRHQVVGAAVGIVGVVFGFFVLGWLGYVGLSHSPFFEVESVNITGSSKFGHDEILSLIGITNQTNLVAVDKVEIAEELKKTGWIRRVSVEKVYPNSLEIQIQERKPLAIVQLQQGLFYFDKSGFVFAGVKPGEALDFPVVHFADETMVAGKDSMKNVTDFLKYTRSGNPALSIQNVSQIMVDEQGNLTLYMADNPFPVQIGQTKMWQKYKRLAKVLGWLYKKKKFDTVTMIDLEYSEGRVLVSFKS